MFPLLADYEDDRGIDWFTKIKDFRSNKDPMPIREAIQKHHHRSRRTYSDAKPIALVLSETIDPSGARTARGLQSEVG